MNTPKIYYISEGRFLPILDASPITIAPGVFLSMNLKHGAGLIEKDKNSPCQVKINGQEVVDIAHLEYGTKLEIDGKIIIVSETNKTHIFRHNLETQTAYKIFTRFINGSLSSEKPVTTSQVQNLHHRTKRMTATLASIALIILGSIFYAFTNKEILSGGATTKPHTKIMTKKKIGKKASQGSLAYTSSIDHEIKPVIKEIAVPTNKEPKKAKKMIEKINAIDPIGKKKVHHKKRKRNIRENLAHRKLLDEYLLEENFDEDSAREKMETLYEMVPQKTKLSQEIMKHIQRLSK